MLTEDTDADPYWDLENAKSYDEIVKILNDNHLVWNLIKFSNMSVVKFLFDGKIYIIDDFESIFIKEAHEWVSNIRESNLEDFFPPKVDNFWTYPQTLYHATTKENVPFILNHGLTKQNKTRGISNRSTGAAIFTSTEPEETRSYGDYVFEINTQLMKKDGYMPDITQETPIVEGELREAIAHRLGLKDYFFEVSSSDGLSNSTIIVYGNIPAKYLKLLD